MEDAVHCLDYQVVNTSTTHSHGFLEYGLQKLSSLREDRLRVEEKAALMEQVATLSALNQSATFSTTPQLVEAMLEEAAKLQKELDRIVSHLLSTTDHTFHTVFYWE